MTVSAVVAGGWLIARDVFRPHITDNSGYSQTLAEHPHGGARRTRHPQDQRDRAQPHRLPRASTIYVQYSERRQCPAPGAATGADGDPERGRAGQLMTLDCDRRSSPASGPRLTPDGYSQSVQFLGERIRPWHPSAGRERDCAGLLCRLVDRAVGLLPPHST